MAHPEDLPTPERNMVGGLLLPCGDDPITGYYRDGNCRCDPDGQSTHFVCVVVTADFLAHQQEIGNDLITARPEWGFPGLVPGDRWCVVAFRWLQSYQVGRAAPVVLAATNIAALEIIPEQALREHGIDVPDDASGLLED